MRKLSTGILLLISSISLVHSVENKFHPNNLFIKMKQGQTLVQSPLISGSKKIIGDIYLVKTKDASKLAESLKDSAAIEYAQKDFYSGPKTMPKHEVLEPNFKDMVNFNFANFNDQHVSKLWGFTAQFGMDVEGAYAALPPQTPTQIIVAVVDTGVDHNHEDLKDVMWENAGEIRGDGIDNDGNGYIDDIHGINTLVRDANGKATMNTMASHWHGTHVAGTIGATQNNGIGIAGVANNVRIMALRTVPDNADELDSDIVEAFNYAAHMGAKVINCSFGKKVNEGGMVVSDVINEIGKKYNVLVVAASGNESSDIEVDRKFPASFQNDNLLVVNATDSWGGLAYFSNYGAISTDVAAPGDRIFSTINNNKYSNASGTSMATPNTVGVAAMVLGYYPTLRATTLKTVLAESVVKVPAFAGKMTSGGRVNLKLALEKARTVRRR